MCLKGVKNTLLLTKHIKCRDLVDVVKLGQNISKGAFRIDKKCGDMKLGFGLSLTFC